MTQRKCTSAIGDPPPQCIIDGGVISQSQIGHLFDQTAQNVYNANNAFESKLNDEERQHEYSPILRKVIEDLEL